MTDTQELREEPTARDSAGQSAIGFGHVGLCVADIDAAARWYSTVFGLVVLDGPKTLEANNARTNEMLQNVFGADFKSARIAQLGFGEDVGLELFEFVEPPTQRQTASYFREGFSHVCFVAEDIGGTLAKIEAAGGRVRTAVWAPELELPYRFVHFEDPFGNLLELHSHRNRETALGLSTRSAPDSA